MKLNKNQIKKMLELFFCEDDDMYKCFDTRNIEWISSQEVELLPNSYGWQQVYMNGDAITTINTVTYKKDFEIILNLV